jgi:hypothetical protein
MPDYTDHAVNDIVDYVWDGLVSAGILDPYDYLYESAPLVPFIPVQDQPEFVNRFGNSPYFIYNVTELPADEAQEWWRMRDEIVFTIVCPDIVKIREIFGWMRDRLRRYDESARLINSYSGLSGKFNYHTSYLMYSQIEDEARNEAGRVEGEIAFCVEYVRYLDADGDYL